MQENRRPLKDVLIGAKELFVLPPTVEITGNTQATIQGAKGIIEYTDELIRVNLGEMEACFYGGNLSICSLTQDSLEIKGSIERVEYR